MRPRRSFHHALVVLDSGVVTAAGTYTGRTFLYFKFPTEKRPLAVAVTTNNEFALFTVWDTKALKSMKHAIVPSSESGIPRDALMVLSRAERRVDWVHVEGSKVEIDRTLRDDRLVDPITLEDADNHGTESFIVSIADHEGKKVLNYRYGPVTYHTNGGERFDMCDDGKGAFEFSGGLDVGGKPFSLSVNNTP